MQDRISKLREAMAASNLHTAMVSTPVHVRYLTGFTGSFGVVLLTASEGRFLTDSRYAIQASEQVNNLDVRTFASPTRFEEFLLQNVREMGIAELGFEASIPYDSYLRWSKALEGVVLTPMDDALKALRMVKDPEEVQRIKEACKLIDAVMDHSSRMIQAGISEFDIGLDIEFSIRRQGAEIAFEPIVVSGARSALPHGRPSEKLLEVGDFVTIDCGTKLDGYCSDITRTFVVGQPSDLHREIYSQVLASLEAAKAMMKPGVNGRDVDARVRAVLDEKGLSQYFGHGLGHGLGLDVHDPGRMSAGYDEVLKEGHVFTVEPGVYISGFGGVRIEDDVLLTAEGIEVLTHFPRELMEMG